MSFHELRSVQEETTRNELLASPESAKATLEQESKSLWRQQRLRQSNATSAESAEQAQHQFNVAEEKVKEIEAKLARYRVAADTEVPEVLVALEDLAVAEASLNESVVDVTLRIEAECRNRGEQAELPIKVFELSQALEERWLTADFSAKRQLLELVFLNPTLDGVTFCYEMRKPFDVLAKGLSVPSNRGDWI